MDTNTLMELIATINKGMVFFNTGLDKIIPILCMIGLLLIWAGYAYNKVKNEGAGKGFYLGAFSFFEAVIVVAVLYFVPTMAGQNAITLRWALIYVAVIPSWYFFTRKHSGNRGVVSVFIILATLTLGWLYDQWVGIILVSAPLMFIYYHVIYKLAQVIYPASNPEDRKEASLKAQAFLVYLLGIQYPVWVAQSSKDGRDYVQVIDGDRTLDVGAPGLIWNASHQVAGISIGIEFERVDGPGIIFTKQFEWPVSTIDLRTQLRVSTVNTVTKDGMEIPSVVFTAFAIDNSAWPKDHWSRPFFSKLKYLIGKDYSIDHPHGSYPYSSARVRAALRTTGVNTAALEDDEKVEIHWDEWVMNQVAHATRQVVSNRSLDELWRPQHDSLGHSALDEMKDELHKLLSPRLSEAGIQLYVARIVNYALDEKKDKEEEGKDNGDKNNKPNNHITQQNIKTWSSYWEKRVVAAQADVEFIYREEIEKAHAYSKSVLLSAIADSIQKARAIREDLPRHVIAQYFVHALEEYIKVLPGTDIKDSKQRIERIKEVMEYSTPEEEE